MHESRNPGRYDRTVSPGPELVAPQLGKGGCTYGGNRPDGLCGPSERPGLLLGLAPGGGISASSESVHTALGWSVKQFPFNVPVGRVGVACLDLRPNSATLVPSWSRPSSGKGELVTPQLGKGV